MACHNDEHLEHWVETCWADFELEVQGFVVVETVIHQSLKTKEWVVVALHLPQEPQGRCPDVSFERHEVNQVVE